MKTTQKVIDAMSEVLTAELTAINQYFVHHAMCESWGYNILASAIRTEAMSEMKHAETLVERILYYEGVPNMQKYDRINVGTDVPSLLKNDLDLEYEAVERLNKLVADCQAEGDYGAADVLTTILKDEEEHVDWLENQLGLIQSLGLENYLSRQFSPGLGA